MRRTADDLARSLALSQSAMRARLAQEEIDTTLTRTKSAIVQTRGHPCKLTRVNLTSARGLAHPPVSRLFTLSLSYLLSFYLLSIYFRIYFLSYLHFPLIFVRLPSIKVDSTEVTIVHKQSLFHSTSTDPGPQIVI